MMMSMRYKSLECNPVEKKCSKLIYYLPYKKINVVGMTDTCISRQFSPHFPIHGSHKPRMLIIKLSQRNPSARLDSMNVSSWCCEIAFEALPIIYQAYRLRIQSSFGRYHSTMCNAYGRFCPQDFGISKSISLFMDFKFSPSCQYVEASPFPTKIKFEDS